MRNLQAPEVMQPRASSQVLAKNSSGKSVITRRGREITIWRGATRAQVQRVVPLPTGLKIS